MVHMLYFCSGITFYSPQFHISAKPPSQYLTPAKMTVTQTFLARYWGLSKLNINFSQELVKFKSLEKQSGAQKHLCLCLDMLVANCLLICKT